MNVDSKVIAIEQFLKEEEWDIINLNETKLNKKKSDFIEIHKQRLDKINNDVNDIQSKGGQLNFLRKKYSKGLQIQKR